MIQITISFDSIPDAHLALGNMMARASVPAPNPADTTGEPGTLVVEVANAAPDEKPKRKPRPRAPGKDKGGRPKGSKDGDDVVRKGTKAAAGNITLESLQTDLSAYANDHGFKQARALLAEFNVKRLSELREDDYFKFGRNMAKTVESNV